MRAIKWLLPALAVLTLAGCKLFIVVPINGKVYSLSGRYLCEGPKTCSVDVVDLFFNQVFVAEASEGYAFAGWLEEDRHFCGGQRNNCELKTRTFEGNDVLMGFLAANTEVFYLSPVFVDPDSDEYIKLRLAGTWDYVQRWGECEAQGQIEQELIAGEGVYQTFTPESTVVVSIEPCQYALAGQQWERRVGPIAELNQDPFNVFALEDAYRAYTGKEADVSIESRSEYTVSVPRDGELDVRTYTRFVDGPSAAI